MIYFLSLFYNEEEFLPEFLSNLTIAAKKIAKRNFKIILVNDGSTDKSLQIVSRFQKRVPIEVISFRKNRGVDAAFKEGFGVALKLSKKGDLIITLESDNTSDLKILPEMIKKAHQGADLVLASCYAKGGGVYGTGTLRQTTSKIANVMLYFVFPIKGVKTYSSFYRLYKAPMLKKAWKNSNGRLITHKGFVCMAELLIKLSRSNIKISEVPMKLKWENRRGKTKMKLGRTIIGYWFLFKDLYLKEKFSG